MRFWDASAVIPLCVTERQSGRIRDLLRQDTDMIVWWAVRVECATALARLRRSGKLGSSEEEAANATLGTLSDVWHEVLPGSRLRSHALRLLRLHELRASDALQLAAAIEWAGFPSVGELVTLDHRLAEAARLEGFSVLP
jgi:predicted nucleic acid-binding protein